ncbi:MAG: metallopeptidase TldD-related protein, partial [Eubacteriales bacterium]
ILIHSVLGLHTQNPVTGDYSLSAPSSLRIINGKIVGKTDVKINGNFWNDLRSSQTLIAYSKLHSHPYLKTETKVENL